MFGIGKNQHEMDRHFHNIRAYTIVSVDATVKQHVPILKFDASWPVELRTFGDKTVTHSNIEFLRAQKSGFIYSLNQTLKLVYPKLYSILYDAIATDKIVMEDLRKLVGVTMHRNITRMAWLPPRTPHNWNPPTSDGPITVVDPPNAGEESVE